MAKYLFTLLISIFFFSSVKSQSRHLECGTETPESVHKLMEEYYESDQKFMKGSMLYLPIKAHIFRRSDGSGGLTEAQLNDAIDAMNEFYINADIQFFICGGINYINNSSYYDFHKSQENSVGNLYDEENTINIYFANTVTSASNQALCGYAYYPGGPDRILMNNSCATNGSTLSHEMGHFFSLMHTHGPSNTRLTNELVNGSNCQSAGDRICDTPADPQLSNSNVNINCVYTQQRMDSNGDYFEPDPKNLMSYSRKTCRDKFSSQQYEIIKYTSRSVRNYFVCTGSLDLAQLPDNEFCGGSELELSFTSEYSFDAANTFSVELSDESGNFTNPSIIGTLNSGSAGNIAVQLPQLTESRSGYRIRIVSTNPAMTGNDNGSDLTLHAIPDIAIEDVLLCETDTFNLATAYVDNANTTGAVSFWEDAAGTTSLASPEAIINSGKYYVRKVTTDGNCEVIVDVDVEFSPLPATPIVTIEEDLLVSSAETGNQWYNLDGPLEGETGKTLQPPYNSIYWVEVNNQVCTSEPSESQRYYLAENGAPVHPNPARDMLYLNHLPESGSAIYRIVDSRGRIIETGELAQSSNQGFNVSTIGRGLYILEINDNGSVTRSKFVKL